MEFTVYFCFYFEDSIWYSAIFPSAYLYLFAIWFSRLYNLTTLSQHFRFLIRTRLDGDYKQKFQKVQLVALKLFDDSKSDGSDAQRVNIIKKEILIFDSIDEYTH